MIASLAFLALLPSAQGQWTDVQKLGTGGESFVSTDDKGNVYVTCHQPCKMLVSNDWGVSFGSNHSLPDAFCDVTTAIGPDGKLYIIYIKPGVKGLEVVTSSDKGKSIAPAGTHDGPFDREWIVVNPVTGEIGFNYSDGYIGGPKSKGIFYAASKDGAKTFARIGRVDKEPAGSYPVDPYLAVGTGGRLYAAWATSEDYDHIDAYKFAASEDGGKTWINHTTLGTTHGGHGDTQERWMLGSLVATGPDTVMAIYQDYAALNVDGIEIRPLLAYYRVSRDGAKSWTKGRPCLTSDEITLAIRSFLKNGSDRKSTVPNYMQTLPWACADPKGRIHLALVDNRAGQTSVNKKNVGLWQVRFTSWNPTKDIFTPSEKVSHSWAAERPPLDFIGCAADSKHAYITWTENPNRTSGWDFTGDLYFGKKALP
jgi:hypothetical protein